MDFEMIDNYYSNGQTVPESLDVDIKGENEVSQSHTDYTNRIYMNVIHLGELKRMVKDDCLQESDDSEQDSNSSFSLLSDISKEDDTANQTIVEADEAEPLKIQMPLTIVQASRIVDADTDFLANTRVQVLDTLNVDADVTADNRVQVPLAADADLTAENSERVSDVNANNSHLRSVPGEVTKSSGKVSNFFSKFEEDEFCEKVGQFIQSIPDQYWVMICIFWGFLMCCLITKICIYFTKPSLTSRVSHEGRVLNSNVPLPDRLKDLEIKILHCLNHQTRHQDQILKTKFEFCWRETGKWHSDLEAYMKQDSVNEFLTSAQQMFTKGPVADFSTLISADISHVDVELIVRQMEHSKLLPNLLLSSTVGEELHNEVQDMHLTLKKTLQDLIVLKQLSQNFILKNVQLQQADFEKMYKDVMANNGKLINDGLDSMNGVETTVASLRSIIEDLNKQMIDLHYSLKFQKLISDGCSELSRAGRYLLNYCLSLSIKISHFISNMQSFHKDIALSLFFAIPFSLLGLSFAKAFVGPRHFDPSFNKTIWSFHLAGFLLSGIVCVSCSFHLWLTGVLFSD